MTSGNKQQNHNEPNEGNMMKNAGQHMDNESGSDQQEERKRANARTEAEARSIDGKAGQSGKSSHDHMSNIKAGTHEGAGGGTKAKRNH